MKIIGITGGIGSGKSLVLHYLERTYRGRSLEADVLAKELIEPDGPCYEAVVALLGRDILSTDGLTIDRSRMSQRVFADDELRRQVNAIIHPVVKKQILAEIEAARQGEERYFFLEAALLVEEEYRGICDELWYIFADEYIRARRLQETRGYSLEKIHSIFRTQLSDQAFRAACDRVIDNSRDNRSLFREIDRAMAMI